MKLFIDTEFNGFGGELLSIGIAPEGNNLRFYGAVTELGMQKKLHPWVYNNVWPKLYAEPSLPAMVRFGKYEDVKHSFQVYIRQWPDPEVICDWPEDLSHFCELLRGDQFGSSLRFPFRAKVIDHLQPHSADPHHALADAEALKEAYFTSDVK
jgi:hypothetical protein